MAKRVEYLWSEHIHAQIRFAEDADTFDVEGDEYPTGEEQNQPSIAEVRRQVIEHFKSALARPPLVGCFRPVGGFSFRPLEIRIINTHIRFSGLVDKRLDEFKQLAGRMYTAINTLRTGSFNTVYTLLMGDYNLSAERLNLLQQNPCFLNSCENHQMETVQTQKTTLRRYDESIADQPEGESCYSKSYDHFSYDGRRVGPLASQARRINYETFKIHRTEISDHVPVVLELNV